MDGGGACEERWGGGESPHRLRFRGRYNGIMGQVINYATCERLRRLKPRYIFLPVLLFVFLLSHRRGKTSHKFSQLILSHLPSLYLYFRNTILYFPSPPSFTPALSLPSPLPPLYALARRIPAKIFCSRKHTHTHKHGLPSFAMQIL